MLKELFPEGYRLTSLPLLSGGGGCTKLMALLCAQVQCSWGENRNTDATDTGGEEATQHGPDLGTASEDKALQDRYAHTDQDSLPGPPGLEAM